MDKVSSLMQENMRLREHNAELLEINEQVRFLFDKNALACLVADWDSHRILNVNEAAVAKYGYSREEFLELTLMELRPPGEFAKLQEFLGTPNSHSGNYSGEWVHQTKAGKILHVEVNATTFPFKGTRARLVAINDLTKRREAEQALSEKEERLRLALDAYRLGVFDWDLVSDKVHWNDHQATIFGLQLEEFDGSHETLKRHIHPDDLVEYEEVFQKSRKGAVDFQHTFRVVHPDQSIHWVLKIGRFYVDSEGNPIRSVGITRDITEERIAERKLHEINQLLTALFDYAPAPIFVALPDSRLLLVNSEWERVAEISRENALGKRLSDLFSPEIAHQYASANRKVIETRLAGSFQEEVLNSQGRLHFHTVKFPLYDEKGEITSVGGISVDVTGSHQLEAERTKLVKMQALGRLAGGIAHDFNNLLQSILGNVSLIRRLLGPESPVDHRLNVVERACRRASGLTLQLLTFSKGGDPVQAPTVLPELIRETVEFALIGTDIVADFEFPSDLREGNVDSGQIGQVFQNLAINAQEAMPGGGRIRVTGQNVTIQDSKHLSPEEYIRFDFSDSGTGISEENLEKIFEPYFTTKKIGSGLGLAVIHSIVSRHNGSVTVSSQIGEGTTFCIFLPASETRSSSPESVHGRQDEDTAIYAGLRILVMDDEPVILEFIEKYLKILGFQVTSVPDGEAALRAFSIAMNSGKDFHLALLDVTIRGGMGGKETLRRLLQICPTLPAIVMSGYSLEGVLSDYRALGFQAALPKPFSGDTLQRIIDQVLNSKE